MIELGRIVYRAEESGQIIEKCIVATADERFDRMAVWRCDGHCLVGIGDCRKATTGKIGKVHFPPGGLIDGDSDFRWLQFVKRWLCPSDRIEHPTNASRLWLLRQETTLGPALESKTVEHVPLSNSPVPGT